MNTILKITSLFSLLIWGTLSSLRAQSDSLKVISPNGQLTFTLTLKDIEAEKSVPFYEIMYQARPLIASSRLGLKTLPTGFGYSDWSKELRITGTAKISQTAKWQPVYGEQSQYNDNFNELTLTFQHTDLKRKGSMQLIIRAYDEGIAFKYHFPEELSTQILEFGDELTHFTLPPDTQAWHTPAAQAEYEKKPLKDWKKSAELPLTLELSNGLYASIAQAEQVNYPRVRLITTEKENVLRTQLFGEVVETSPFSTSWRVVMVAETPSRLLENNYLILNLNPPSEIKNTAWIKPGLVMREVTLSTDGAKKLVDFAVDQLIDYIHFDAGWYGYEYEVKEDATTVTVDPRRNPKGDLDLQEAIRYAASKGIKVILYVNHRALERQLDTLLPLYKRWGVAGIKYGFVHTGSHRWTAWLHEAVKKAAKYEMVLDIHDEYRPSGFSRTYPNLLTQEGVLGNEGFPDATHNTVLPFTRYIAGAADYTYCFNVETIRPGISKTTKAHQLALPVIFYSPLQYVFWYGKPEHYPNKDEIEFWKGIPTVWDETKVVNGRPGESVTVARRKGSVWYAGIITNNQARTVDLTFSFLQPDKTYTATLYEDDGTGKIKRTDKRVTSTSVLPLVLAPAGGACLKIR